MLPHRAKLRHLDTVIKTKCLNAAETLIGKGGFRRGNRKRERKCSGRFRAQKKFAETELRPNKNYISRYKELLNK